jgi:hypothetical protein
MIRTGDHVGYEGAIFALQRQDASIHPGGRTALSLLGRAHYLELAEKNVTVFGGKTEKLPAWFKNHDWGVTVNYHPTSFLPPEMGLTEVNVAQRSFSIRISDPVRAIMECLYLAPERQDLMECYHLMEGLNNLVPDWSRTCSNYAGP